MNSIIVGTQYHKGVNSLNKGDVVELSFNDETHEFPTGIRVLNSNGVVIGNIIANMNHPSLTEDVIINNNIKNNNQIRKITTTNCKATVVAIKRYVVFITIHTSNDNNVDENNNNGDENMELETKINELEEKIKENKKKRKELRKERVEMKKQLRKLKEELKNANEVVEKTTDAIVEETTNKGESMESKLAKVDTELITNSVMKRKVPLMVVEMQQNELSEAFEKAKDEYTIETVTCTTKYNKLHPIANILLTLRSIDDIVANKYLNGEVDGGEFDYVRVHIGIHSYFFYEHLIEEINMDEFFSEASMRASEKFLKEEEERGYVCE